MEEIQCLKTHRTQHHRKECKQTNSEQSQHTALSVEKNKRFEDLFNSVIIK